MDWNEEEALRTLADSVEVAQMTIVKSRELLLEQGKISESLGDTVTELKAFVDGLNLYGSRKDGHMGRSDAQKLQRTLDKLAKPFDVDKFLRVSADLMSQTKSLMEMMKAVAADFRPKEQGEDWESHLTMEQLLTVMQWVEENKNANKI